MNTNNKLRAKSQKLKAAWRRRSFLHKKRRAVRPAPLSLSERVRGTVRWIRINRLKSAASLASVAVLLIGLFSFVFTGASATPITKQGSFTKPTSTGSQAITGVGFKPKAVVFYWTLQTATGTAGTTGSFQGMGFATGASNEAAASMWDEDQTAAGATDSGRIGQNDATIVIQGDNGAINGRADLTSLDADGFTLNWSTANASAYIIHYYAFNEEVVTNATVNSFSLTTGTGNLSVTNAGFQPDFVMFLSAMVSTNATNTAEAAFMYGAATSASDEWSVVTRAEDAQDFSDVCSQQRTDASIIFIEHDGNATNGTDCDDQDAIADFTQFTASGFDINKSDAPAAARNVYYLALEGPSFKVGNLTKPTATGSQSVSGVGFSPGGVFFASRAEASGTTVSAESNIVIGAASGIGGAISGEGAIAGSSNDNNDASNPGMRTTTSKAISSIEGNAETLTGEANLTLFGADGFTLDWTTADGTADEYLYWAVGPPNPTPEINQKAYIWENDDGDAGAMLDWYNTDWGYRKSLTIESDEVPNTDQTDFPVLINTTHNDFRVTGSGGHVGQADGGDIVFTTSTGTKLSHELERYTSTTGEVIAWVKVPTVSSSTDTVLYMYYGNAGVGDQWNVTDTWSNGYEAVYHLSGSVNDSTTNAHNATDNGTADISAIIGNGRDFEFGDSTDRLQLGTWSVSGAELTIQAWARFESFSDSDARIISKANGINADNHVWMLGSTQNTNQVLRMRLKTGTSDANPTSTLIACSTCGQQTTATWYHTAATYDTNEDMKVFNNGAETASANHAFGGDLRENTYDIYVGNNPGGTNAPFDGILDEVRISSTARTSDWLTTEYNNQSAPGTFYAFGSEETPPASTSNTQLAAANTAITVPAGQRLSLRIQLDNTGTGSLDDRKLGLFYDRNDGIFSKVRGAGTPAITGDGNCTDTNWDCVAVDADTDETGENSSVAVDADGYPWVSYLDYSDDALMVARYVGSGGSGCGASGSSAWSCEKVLNPGGGINQQTSIGISPVTNKPWISYYEGFGGDLMVAEYVGDGTGSCTSSDWDCTIVYNASSGGAHNAIAFDGYGNPWIAYLNVSGSYLMAARYVGGSSGSGCASSAWTCTTIDDPANNVGEYVSIAFDNNGKAWVSYYDASSTSCPNDSACSLKVAEYVGSGGSGCTNTAWTCTTVDNTTTNLSTGLYTSIAVAPDGDPWVSYYDATNTSLKVAEYVGSGGNCTSGAWNCANVDADSDDTGQYTAMAFDPAGRAWVSYYDNTADSRMVARYVGSGGSGCGASGSTAWICTTVDNTGTNTGDTFGGIAFGADGTAWISYYDTTNTALRVANTKRGGEIVVSAGQAGANGDTIFESHADMSSVSDSSNRNDADCISGSTTWNNGSWFESENGQNISLPAGNTTAQCTEVVFTIDTSRATPGTTYRFVVATDDSWALSRGVWRGPTTVTQFGTLTIGGSTDTLTRVSQDVLPKFTDCADSAWGCASIDTDASTQVGYTTWLAFDPSGIPWTAFVADDNDLFVAKYVGSGGDCENTAWECTELIASGVTGYFSSIAFDSHGNPWVSAKSDDFNVLIVAHYVGSGGTGCDATSEWTCEAIDSGNGLSVIVLDNMDRPWIFYTWTGTLQVARYVGSGGSGCSVSTEWTCDEFDAGSTGWHDVAIDRITGKIWVSYLDNDAGKLRVAEYVGTGGSGCDLSSWTCTVVDSLGVAGNSQTGIEIDANGTPWVSYGAGSTDLYVATYVGSSGSNCDTGTWDCTPVDTANSVGNNTSLSLDGDGRPWVSYYDETNTALRVARYIPSGGSGCASGNWSCTTVDSANAVGENSSIAFDHSGTPWVTYKDSTSSDYKFRVAKMHLPPTRPSASGGSRDGRANAVHGDSRYRLTPGKVDANSEGQCVSSSAHANGYCSLFSQEGFYDSLSPTANHRPVYTVAVKTTSNGALPTIDWYGTTSVAPSTNNVVIQAYRFGSTNAWENVVTDSASSDCSVVCTLSVMSTGTISEYFEADGSSYWTYFRIWQEEHSSSQTFKVDYLRAIFTLQAVRHGGEIRDGIKQPLN